MTRRAKIVCTLGPATSTAERVRGLVDAGMDMARLNFSHGTQSDHESVYHLVRQAADANGRAVGVLADLQGPKIRLGRFAGGRAEWRTGDTVVISATPGLGSNGRATCTYPRLAAEVRPGDRLLVDDGRISLEVRAVDGDDVTCLVVEGGTVSDHKGVSLPNVAVSVPALSGKDADDLRFALRLGVDLVALSFVRTPDDVKAVRAVMDEVGIRRPVLAKLEKPEAVAHLEAVVTAFDGVMVARGDLGVELPLEAVPLVQKQAVQLCRENAKPVIVATQMLDSMIESSRPTRAEASDVANAVLDGADALMLSGETSVGAYPVLTVATMSRIVSATEAGSFGVPRLGHDPKTRGGAIALAAAQVAVSVGAKALVAFTQTGDTVRRLARLHCGLPLLAFTPEPAVRNQLALAWGVETFLMPFVALAGSPPGRPGSTDTLRVHQLGSLAA